MKRICIVDDDEAVRESLAAFLESCGYTSSCFASASAFLSAEDEAPPYLCMLVDVHMPGMSGIELVNVLRTHGVDIPAILITAAADAPLRAAAEKLGGLVLLDKPVDGDALLETIARVGKS